MPDTLPKLPMHPEPHTYTWTALELEAIERYGAECRRQALEHEAGVYTKHDMAIAILALKDKP